MMRAVVVLAALAALATPASADRPVRVTGALSAAELEIPEDASITGVTVRAPDGVHQLPLVDATAARKAYEALGTRGDGTAWAALVERSKGTGALPGRSTRPGGERERS